MRKFSLAICLALMVAQPVTAADQMASEASVKRLFASMDQHRILDTMLEQIEATMRASVSRALLGQPLTAEQQKIVADMQSKLAELLKTEMSWKELEPMFVDVYRKTFTEQEVDGMVAFYQSSVGKAVITKMPTAMKSSMQAMQERVGVLTPKFQQLMQDTLRQIKATPAAGQSAPQQARSGQTGSAEQGPGQKTGSGQAGPGSGNPAPARPAVASPPK